MREQLNEWSYTGGRLVNDVQGGQGLKFICQRFTKKARLVTARTLAVLAARLGLKRLLSDLWGGRSPLHPGPGCPLCPGSGTGPADRAGPSRSDQAGRRSGPCPQRRTRCHHRPSQRLAGPPTVQLSGRGQRHAGQLHRSGGGAGAAGLAGRTPSGDWCQVCVDAPDGTIRHHTVAHSTPADAAALARLADRGPIDLTGAHLTPDADQSLLLEQLTPDVVGRIAQDADHLELLIALDLGSAMVVPLAGRTRILGTITFGQPPTRPLHPGRPHPGPEPGPADRHRHRARRPYPGSNPPAPTH